MAAATILFDSAKNVSKTYGVLALPSSMHRGQFPGHTYLIVDKEGTIRFIKDDPQMAVRNDELKAQLAKVSKDKETEPTVSKPKLVAEGDKLKVTTAGGGKGPKEFVVYTNRPSKNKKDAKH